MIFLRRWKMGVSERIQREEEQSEMKRREGELTGGGGGRGSYVRNLTGITILAT